MEKTLKSIDIGPLGKVKRDNGEEIVVPRLSNLKLIQIAKFLGIEGMKLYDKFKDTISDPLLAESEKVGMILTDLPEETVIHLLSILLELEDEETLQLDPVETLEIIEVYVDNVNVGKAFTIVRSLAKKLFKKEIPDVMKMVGNDSLKSS